MSERGWDVEAGGGGGWVRSRMMGEMSVHWGEHCKMDMLGKCCNAIASEFFRRTFLYCMSDQPWNAFV